VRGRVFFHSLVLAARARAWVAFPHLLSSCFLILQEKLRPLWRHYFTNTDGLIYVVDCADRERVARAAAEFRTIINDPLMRGAGVLIFANKQDLPGALSTAELCAAFGMGDLRGRKWHVQGAVATKGEGLYEGLDWLAAALKSMSAGRLVTEGGGGGQ